MQKISIKNSDFFSRKFCNGKSALNQSASRTVQGKAFTLIELLIVIMIVGILTGFILVSMSSATNSARDAKRKTDISAIAKAISMYSAQNGGALPSTGTSCDVCNGCAGACANLYPNIAPYLTSLPTDPNGTTVYYKYTYSATLPSFTLQSTLGSGALYQFDSSTDGFAIISYVSTCASATNAQVSCSPITINSTEEACVCTRLSGAGTTTWAVPTGVASVQYLVVGGGGGGHSARAGGGGAGGYRAGTGLAVSSSVTITVGAGGASDASGTGSVFGSIAASGGGMGGGWNGAGASGGSGGGAGVDLGTHAAGGAGNAGGYTPVEGYKGGDSYPYNSGHRATGGGGGSSAVGIGTTFRPDGGAGTSNSITGAAVFYAGGGGGGDSGLGYTSEGYGLGGSGIGGNGGGQTSANVNGGAGTPNTGSGGGGGGGYSGVDGAGGAGSSGVVIFRYTHP